MSDRERKRAERRKRKQRGAGSQAEAPGDEVPEGNGFLGTPPGTSSPGTPPIDLVAEAEAKGPSRAELRDQESREVLEPLEDGKRPTVVTVGAIVSLLVAASILVGYFAGIEVDPNGTGASSAPSAFQAFPPALLFAVMGWGMWRARYWAVLGFQAMMAIFMLVSFIGLIGATGTVQALGAGAILIASGALFWFTVKALARIQMPTYPTGSK